MRENIHFSLKAIAARDNRCPGYGCGDAMYLAMFAQENSAAVL